MTRLLPVFAMVGAVLLWASSSSGSKLALAQVSVPEVVTFRIVGAAVVLWAVLIGLRREFRLPSPIVLVMGILEPALVTFFIVLGLSRTSAVNASVVWGIMPLTQPLLARVILKEPLERSMLFGAALAISGTLLLFATKSEDGTGSLDGDFYLVCGVLSASINQMLARRVALTHGQPIVVTAYQLLSAAVASLIYLSVAVPSSQAYQAVDALTYAILCYLIVATAGPFFLYNYALQTLSVGRVSLFSPLAGPIGVVVATLVFREPLSPAILVAIGIAVTGALLPTWVTWRRERRANAA